MFKIEFLPETNSGLGTTKRSPSAKESFPFVCRRLPGRDHDGAAAAQDQLPPAADVPAVGAVRHRRVALSLPAAGVHPGQDHHGHDDAPHARRHVRRRQVSQSVISSKTTVDCRSRRFPTGRGSDGFDGRSRQEGSPL